MPRPNVASRPVCRYYNTPRGCFAGNHCHYLHGDPEVQKYAPYEESKTCRFYVKGFCKRGFECWFRHVDPTLPENVPNVSDICLTDLSCGICFEEKPAIYGLLSDCSHGFCLECIRQWRDPQDKGQDMTGSGVHKTCPMCRAKTKFVVPSSVFYMQGDPRKAQIIQKYKESMAKVPCRYFMKSPPSNKFCPFGRDCFYQHLNDNGTPYAFRHGVDVMMKHFRRHNEEHQHEAEVAPSIPTDPVGDTFQAVLEVLERFSDSLTMEEIQNGLEDTESRRVAIGTHVGAIMRIMNHSPALQALDALERMAGEDPEEETDERPLEISAVPEEAGPSTSFDTCDRRQRQDVELDNGDLGGSQ